MINIDIFGINLSINPVLLIIGLVIGLCIYMYCFAKRNPGAELIRYFQVLMNFITLCIVTIFLIVACCIIAVLDNKQYMGLVIPIVWFLISYSIIKKIIAQDFQINIGNVISIDWNKWGPIGIQVIFCLAFSFATFCIFAVIPDMANQPYGPVPVIIAAIIFLLITIILCILTYKTITGKVNLERRKQPSYFTLFNKTLSLSDDANEEEIKEDKKSTRIFLIIWGTFAFLFVAMFVYIFLVDKGVIRI